MKNKEEETEKRVMLLEHEMNELRCNVQRAEENITSLDESVKRAVNIMIPKVDALLKSQENNQRSDVIVSDIVIPPVPRPIPNDPVAPDATLIAMAERGDAQALRHLLLTGTSPFGRNSRGDTAIHVAAAGGHLEAVATLLGAGVSATSRGRRLRLPLHCAAVGGHVAVTQLLLAAGTDVNATDVDAAAAIDLAAREGHADVVSFLLSHGASWEAVATSVSTSLLHASLRGHWDVMTLILQRGTCDAVDADGNTVLEKAAMEEQWDAVRLLLRSGACPVKCNAWETSVLTLASKRGQEDVLRQLLRGGSGRFEKHFKSALSVAKNANVVWIFAEFAPTAVMGAAGKFALPTAARDGRQDVVVALLNAGVDANSTQDGRWTGVHRAAWKGHHACIVALLEHGANKDAKAANGDTALLWASKSNHVECVRVLVEAGASITETNDKNESPLDVAMSDTVRRLLEE